MRLISMLLLNHWAENVTVTYLNKDTKILAIYLSQLNWWNWRIHSCHKLIGPPQFDHQHAFDILICEMNIKCASKIECLNLIACGFCLIICTHERDATMNMNYVICSVCGNNLPVWYFASGIEVANRESFLLLAETFIRTELMGERVKN